MTSESSNKRNHRHYDDDEEEEYQESKHREPAGHKSSLSDTGQIKADVDSRSVVQEDLMDFQQRPHSSDAYGYKDGGLLLPIREATRQGTQRNERNTDQEEGLFSRVPKALRGRFPWLMTSGSSAMTSDKRPHLQHSLSRSARQSTQQLHHSGQTGRIVLGAANIDEAFNAVLENKDKDHAAKERKLKGKISDLQCQIDKLEDTAHKLQVRNELLESAKQAIEEKHNTFVRKQQEESFRKMPNSRWASVEDGKVMEDLDRLKRNMRSWAKSVSINDIDALLQSLNRIEGSALWNTLEHVVLFEDGKLPQGLSSRKAPALLLNALLSHSIYSKLFGSPFFFLGEEFIEGKSIKSEYRVGLEELYKLGCRSNKDDAHIWRSQTLRLQLPSIATESSENEKRLHDVTESMIAKAADRQASNFLEGAARYLINIEARVRGEDKLKAIFHEAATMSYLLWTRRTSLQFGYTLHDLNYPVFNPDTKYWVPHSSVDYESHEDQLHGKAISILLHPLVMVYGTEDGKDYDQQRVWAPAEVWLDSSRKPSA
ncbi:hypothetical protein DSL72_001096 [Monilinia vaccinii-corymbosi]|uniref:Uncharacterized protein n=1 Tax=Monilinia vaccinii-corymbosi TaxID=61207 RepID=A0A8A3P9X3_9HELO|nr:hypothetical protein DSL72_001096 [Monilinia vaccinii-corymbosi]